VAEHSIGLATIELARNDAPAAERVAAAAAAQFAGSGARDFEALARLVRARALLVTGNRPEAQREVERAAAIAAKSSNPEVQITYDIVHARLLLDGRQYAAARSLAARAARAAHKANLLPAEFEARLTEAESSVMLDRAAGTAALRAIADSATRTGLVLYRDRALRLLGKG
jgi:hypothetical protein